MALQTRPEYTFDDYLATEREALDEKNEYVASRVYAMTGATYNHNLIVTNLARELGNEVKGRPCAVLTNDMRVRIESADACEREMWPGSNTSPTRIRLPELNRA